MSAHDAGADDDARQLGNILENLVLSGATSEVLGRFAMRHVRQLDGRPLARDESDLEALLERFGKRVAREVLAEHRHSESNRDAASDMAGSAGSRASHAVQRAMHNPVHLSRGSSPTRPLAEPQFEPGSLAALLATRCRKLSVRVGEQETSISVPSGLHAAMAERMGARRVRELIEQWANEATGNARRSQQVRDKMSQAWSRETRDGIDSVVQGLMRR